MSDAYRKGWRFDDDIDDSFTVSDIRRARSSPPAEPPAPQPPQEPAEVVWVRPGWQDRAACRGVDPAVFFPEPGSPGGADEARAVCAGCPVVGPCRSAGLRERFGVWGGTSERERRKLRRQRSTRRTPAPCGTLAGHRRHRSRGEAPCEACRVAYNAHQRDYRAGRGGAA